MDVSSPNDLYGFEIFRRSQQAAKSPYNPYDGSRTNLTATDVLLKLDAPLQIQWTVSRRCNFNCPHCFNNSGPMYHGYEPPRDAVIENICDAKPFNVCLCGGEPFFWEDLFHIISKLRSGGIAFVGMVTNAYLVTPEKLRRAVDAGLNMIQISFDGFTPEDHAINRPAPGSWERARDVLRECAKYPVFDPLAVSFIPNRVNIERFREFARMAIELGCKAVRTQPLMSCGRAAFCYDKIRPTAQQYLWLKMAVKELWNESLQWTRQCACDSNLAFEWGDPLEHVYLFSKLGAIPQHLAIQANGWFEVSPYLPVLFGDVTRHSIRELWNTTRSTKELWGTPIVQKMSALLTGIDGMREVRPRIYFDDHVLINRFDAENWALAQKTDDADTLMAYARRKGYYNFGEAN